MAGLMRKLMALNHTAHAADLDDPNTTLIHREIILKKPFLKKIYIRWYNYLLENLQDTPEGKVVEIGSGGGFLKDIYPEVITSDIMPLPTCDMTFAGENMPFEDNSLRAIVMVNVFHHIPNARAFLREAQRVLKPGGKIVMVEPYYSPWSHAIYRRFHHEPFDISAGWEFPSKGPLSDSNQGLPYIVFTRDRETFNREFPTFKITAIQPHSPLSYLLSGGVSMKSLLPGWSFGAMMALEKICSSRHFNMFATIVVQKQQL